MKISVKPFKPSVLSTGLLCVIALSFQTLIAQQRIKAGKVIHIPFEAQRFESSGRGVEFTTYEGLQVMKILPSSTRQTVPVTLKGFSFTNGTIEFDARLYGPDFENSINVNFHQQDIYNFESLYLRTQADESEQRSDAIQYTPFIHGVNLWDIMTPYRGYARIDNQRWNHFKLVISGRQMLVYINSKDKPAMQVPRLEGNTVTGALSFDGEAMFANLIIKPGETEGLSPNAGMDLTDNDPKYIRHWEVSAPAAFSASQILTEEQLPKDTTRWMPIAAERRGLINLNRRFEGNEFTSYPRQARYVWLRTQIRATMKKTVKLDLGFNKIVFVYVNRRLLYQGQNEAGNLFAKNPEGRIDITNATLEVPLKQGNNELLIGIATNLYGWGIIGKVERLDDIFIQN